MASMPVSGGRQPSLAEEIMDAVANEFVEGKEQDLGLGLGLGARTASSPTGRESAPRTPAKTKGTKSFTPQSIQLDEMEDEQDGLFQRAEGSVEAAASAPAGAGSRPVGAEGLYVAPATPTKGDVHEVNITPK